MPNQIAPLPKLIFNFNWKISLCVLFLFAVLMRLGFWQLERAALKREMQNQRNSRQSDLPVAIEGLIMDNLNQLDHTKVSLSGSYINEQTMLVSNQIFQRRPGYEVITAFKLQSSNQIVLVRRGWISVEYNSRQLPAIAPVTGLQHLQGTVHVPPAQSFFLPQKFTQPVSWPIRLHHFSFGNISKLFNRPVVSFVVRLDDNQPGLLQRHWRHKKLLPENSISYAIQWFGMGLIVLLVSFIKSTNIVEIIRSLNKDKT